MMNKAATAFALLLLCLTTACSGFTAPRSSMNPSMSSARFASKEQRQQESDFDVMGIAASTLSFWATSASVASAAGPDWGIFEGKTMSLLHPAMMGSLLLFSLYTAFLGFQWRRQRTLGDDISALRKTLPDLEGATSVKEAIATADGSRLSVLQSALEVEAQVTALTQERKDLAAAAPRDKHFSQGALLVFAGTLFAIEGSLIAYCVSVCRARSIPMLVRGNSFLVLICMLVLDWSCFGH